MQLNRYQQEAVLDDSNTCLVNANVGSGKTTVLIEKIRYLHEEKQVPFSDMCVLTFTNKAAGEIRERMNSQFPTKEESEMMLFGTFHGVALRMLQEYLPVEELGFREEFQVMTPEEELEMALQLTTQQGLKIKYKNRMKKRLDQEGRTDSRPVRYQDDWPQLMELLKEEKRKENKMTYRELLQNATQLLQSHPEKISLQWIIIDEVQDCDQLQMAFLEQLKKPETHLFAVGDPNQVIYSWRGSVFQIFPLLRMKYQARELSLPVNYRSTGTILEAAKRFLQNGAQLEGCREEGQKIVIKNHYDAFQEADYLAGRIRELHQQGVPYGEIGIFYRLQNQSEILEKTFDRYEIPCQVSVKKSMQDIPVLHWFFYVLKAICYPEDEASLEQALGDKQYGEGWTQKKLAKEVEKIRTEAKTAGRNKVSETLLDRIWYLQNAMAYSSQDMRTEENEPGTSMNLKVNWREMLLTHLHLEEQILPTTVSYQEDMAYVKRLLDDLEKMGVRKLGLGECLNQLALGGMHLEETEDEQPDTVKLMTLHASKGLEFSHVFLIGVNYGLIPLPSGGMESEEEERRLFFVGMTRAKKYLELSYYTSPDGPRVMAGPSRFLRFLPERLVEAPEGFREERRDRESAQAHLQDIKKQMEQARREKAGRSCAVPETGAQVWQERDDQHSLVQEISKQNVQQESRKHEAEPEKTGMAEADKIEAEQQFRENETSDTAQRQRVRHARYGIGEITEENEMQIVVEFPDYGKKAFIRQFAPLEYLDD